MNEAATIEPALEAGAAAPARAELHLADLGEARGITLRFLRRMDGVAERMTPDEQAEALARKGQMVLNLTRADRALRQIVVLEQEVMGLRQPATPRGAGSGGRGNGGGGPDDSEETQSDQDLNDLNDIREFDDLYDLDDADDLEEYEDLASLEKYETFEKYQFHRKRDWDRFAREGDEEDEEDGDQTEAEAIAEWQGRAPAGKAGPNPQGASDEIWEARQAQKAEEEALKAEFCSMLESRWKERREGLLRRRAPEKRLKRRGRWPPPE